jgi:hypothetical protein
MVKFFTNSLIALALSLTLSGCIKPHDFELTVVPKSMDAIAGQRCVFLV